MWSVTKDAYDLPDYGSRILAKVDRQGNLVARQKESGQGSGEMNSPITVTAGEGKVIVAE